MSNRSFLLFWPPRSFCQVPPDFRRAFPPDGDGAAHRRGAVRLDVELLAGRFGGGLTSAAKPEKAGKRKDRLKTRVANIKSLLKAHLRSAYDAYWHEGSDGTSAMTVLPRPSLENICGELKSRHGEKETLNVSTVHRTIQAALDPKDSCHDAELKVLWEGCLDEGFIRRYASKHKME